MPTISSDHAVGDLVVLGHDGVARIEDITEATPNGTPCTMLKLTVLSARMSVTIPLERAQQRGLRRVADQSEADRFCASFGAVLTARRDQRATTVV